jgi:hypothetical protein
MSLEEYKDNRRASVKDKHFKKLNTEYNYGRWNIEETKK